MTLIRLGALADGVTSWHDAPEFDRLVVSWTAPPRPGAEIAIQVSEDDGWFTVGRAEAGRWHSLSGQEDTKGVLDVDVLRLAEPAHGFRARVRGTAAASLAVCVAGASPESAQPAQTAAGLELELRPITQQAFAGLHPELDGGGASWCSPTSLAMVLAHWGITRSVPEVARAVYDASYGGCGNWSANVAYAGSLGLDAVVTWLPSLQAARPLLESGVPLILSIACAPGRLPGFPLEHGTTGHLVVLAGETDARDPIVLDPAAPTDGDVRRVYPRAPFEAAWLHGSGGTAYVVRPHDHPVPPSDLW